MALDFFLTSISVGGRELSLSLGFALLTGVLAAAKGRNFFVWALIGGFTSCIGLIVLLCLPDAHAKEEDTEDLDREQRRLSERLKQEQLKNREFQSSVLGRLDTHDGALGMDTRQVRAPGDLPAAPLTGDDAPAWWYEEAGHAAGPISRRALEALFTSGQIDDETLVWCEGLEDWVPLGSLGEEES